MVDRNIPEKGIQCVLEGILESICVPLETVKEQLPFCASSLHDNICVPVYHVSKMIYCFHKFKSNCGLIGLGIKKTLR